MFSFCFRNKSYRQAIMASGRWSPSALIVARASGLWSTSASSTTSTTTSVILRFILSLILIRCLRYKRLRICIHREIGPILSILLFLTLFTVLFILEGLCATTISHLEVNLFLRSLILVLLLVDSWIFRLFKICRVVLSTAINLLLRLMMGFVSSSSLISIHFSWFLIRFLKLGIVVWVRLRVRLVFFNWTLLANSTALWLYLSLLILHFLVNTKFKPSAYILA